MLLAVLFVAEFHLKASSFTMDACLATVARPFFAAFTFLGPICPLALAIAIMKANVTSSLVKKIVATVVIRSASEKA